MDTVQIGDIGERHVAAWLRQNGYTVMQNTKLPGSTDIEADGPASLLVQVKTAAFPSEPAYPSDDEIRNIKSRASNLKRTAYVAQVQIDEQGALTKEILWSIP
jgi:hypothetical protein